MNITSANCVNTQLHSSQSLQRLIDVGYALAAGVIFFGSGLPLEAKAFGLVLLLLERRRYLKKARQLAGHFFLHIEGICRFQGGEYRVKGVHFFSRYLIVLDIEKDQKTRRLPLIFDAVIPEDFCHISRICLALKR